MFSVNKSLNKKSIMAGTPIEISMIKQLLRLHQQGLGIKAISRILCVSKNTVKRYLHQIEVAGYDILYLMNQSDESLVFILSGQSSKVDNRFAELEKLFPSIGRDLEKTGFTLHYIWCRYKSNHPEGYQYSRFCHYYQRYRETTKAVMHFDHEPGDRLFLDYAGKKLSYMQYGTGEIIECEFFVAVLGYSQYTYAEASLSQQKDDFIASVENALHYYGGVPRVLVPDNLKSAVTKSCRYDPCLNEDFQDMANHYQCAIMPARSHKPRDKSLVENHIRTLYTRVHAALSAITFFSLEDLNQAITGCIGRHNAMLFQGKEFSRKQTFEQVEQPLLHALPAGRFEIKRTHLVTVMKNTHVQLREDKHYYSVPYRYIGEKVKLRYTSKDINIYLKGERIACHLRDKKPYRYTTVKEHLPSQHQFVSEWNPEKFIRWAEGIHPDVKAYIEGILSQSSYPETLYRACVGVLALDKKAGRERLIKACQMGIQMNTCNYGFISRIIRNGTDKLLIENNSTSKSNEHENLRGADYYKKMCHQ
jgi:transposase